MARRDTNSGDAELSRRDFVGNSVKGAAAVALATADLGAAGQRPRRRTTPAGTRQTGADVSVLCLGG